MSRQGICLQFFKTVFMLLCLSALQAHAGEPVARIAIIIDDLGQQKSAGLKTAALPGPVACAVLPHTPWAARVANEAHDAGKEVLLHLPLQAMETSRLAGTGEISLDNSRDELFRIFATNMSTVPHVSGVNNHMGSLITRHPGHMEWLMQAIAEAESDGQQLFFVDSRTTALTVGFDVAVEQGVPAASRNVFLDDDDSEVAIRQQFERLIAMALRDGQALAVGHPYPATLKVLNEQLPLLSQRGVELVSVRDYIDDPAAGASPEIVPPAADHNTPVVAVQP